MKWVVIVLFLLGSGMGQGGPQTQAKRASQPCVIVKRHVHVFTENMTRFHPHRPFDYVEGEYPSGFKWRSELSDGQVRELQQKGGRVVIMRPDYQTADLEDARKQCLTRNNEPQPGGKVMEGTR